MSKQGKAIATVKLCLDITQVILKANIQFANLHGLVREVMIENVKQSCIYRSSALQRTPHQWFNDEGKIDKRKKRRHERKCGAKVHTSRIIRPKTGKYTEPQVIELRGK